MIGKFLPYITVLQETVKRVPFRWFVFSVGATLVGRIAVLVRFAICAWLVWSAAFGSLPAAASETDQEPTDMGIKNLVGIYLPGREKDAAVSTTYLAAQYARQENIGIFRSQLTLIQPDQRETKLESSGPAAMGVQEVLQEYRESMSDHARAFFTDPAGEATLHHISGLRINGYLAKDPGGKEWLEMSQFALKSLPRMTLVYENELIGVGAELWLRDSVPKRDLVVLCEAEELEGETSVLPPEQQPCSRFERVPLIGTELAGKSSLEILSTLQAATTPHALIVDDVTLGGGNIAVSAAPFSQISTVQQESSGGWESWFNQIQAQNPSEGRRISCVFPMEAAAALKGLDKGAVVSFMSEVKQVTDRAVTLDCAPYPG